MVEIAESYSASLEAIAVAWLLAHPANFSVVLGTGKIERVRAAGAGGSIKLTRQDWFRIWTASKRCPVP